MAAIPNIDLLSFKDIQKEIHLPVEEGELIWSYNARDYRKMTWSAYSTIQMPCLQQGDINIYTCPENFHNLLYTYRVHKLPLIKVRVEYSENIRICWPHNIGNNICKRAVVKFGGKEGPRLDTKSLDIYTQFFSENSDMSSIGNIPELENWGTILPRHIIRCFDPWYYTKDPSLALPLYLQIPITHEYKFFQKISDLLRIQEKVGENEWRDIPYNNKYFDIESEKFDTPEIWGRFGLFDGTNDSGELGAALNFWKDEGEDKPETEKIFFFDDFIEAGSNNPVKLGDKIITNMESTRPVKAIFWLVENLNNTKSKNLSRYTHEGKSPWKKYQYCYYLNTVRSEGEYYQASSIEPRFHAKKVPVDIGYGMYSYSVNPVGLDGEVGVVLTGLNAQLILELGTDDPYSFEQKEEDYPGLFQLHSRLLVTRRLSFKYIKGSVPYKFEVSID